MYKQTKTNINMYSASLARRASTYFLQTLGFTRVFRRYNGALVLEHPRTLGSASANPKVCKFACLNKLFACFLARFFN